MKTFAISIPKPCHEDWNNMTPDAKGAFCGSCQKSVYDFSDKTDEEIISVFEREETGKVCGRFAPAQLSRPVVSFGNVTSTNRLAVFLYALLLAFGVTLFNGAEAFGQTQAVKGEMKVKVMGKMAMRPIEPVSAVDNDTTIQIKQIPPTVCGTKTIVDNRIMTLGQVSVQSIVKEPDPVIKTMGDTVIQKISVLSVIETPPIVDEIPSSDTVEVIAPLQNLNLVAGGISYTQIPNAWPQELVNNEVDSDEVESILTSEKIIPVVDSEKVEPTIISETIVPPVDDSAEVRSTFVSETIITPPSDLDVKVSPNPSSGLIILSYNLETSMPVQIDLFDITGKKVKTLTQTGNQYAGKYNVSYNIGDLPNGIYIATLLTNDRKSSAKIILTK